MVSLVYLTLKFLNCTNLNFKPSKFEWIDPQKKKKKEFMDLPILEKLGFKLI